MATGQFFARVGRDGKQLGLLAYSHPVDLGDDHVALTAEQYAAWASNPDGFTWHAGALAEQAATPAVPYHVTMLQARLALHATPGRAQGKTMLDEVSAAVAASTDPRLAIAWEYATTVERHGQFVTGLQPALSLTDAQVDALFVAAAQITT